MKTVFKLLEIKQNHSVTEDRDFQLLIQRAALLGLKDAGTLSEMEYRGAEETLLRQHREAVRAIHTGVSGND